MTKRTKYRETERAEWVLIVVLGIAIAASVLWAAASVP